MVGLSHQCQRITSVSRFLQLLWLLFEPFCRHSCPLYTLLYKKVNWNQTNTEQFTMHSLCTALCSHSVLDLPDSSKPFCIESNASDTAVGSVLTQEHAFVHRPIVFLSKTLNSSKQNYSVHDWELLAIVIRCKAWCPYIDGQHAVVLTDHKPFIHLYTFPLFKKANHIS